MLCLSQSVGYAIQALACLEDGCSASRRTRDLAACSEVPAPYLAKLLKKLADADIVVSRRGIGGGTWLKRPAKTISLFEISEAIDGREWLGRCLLGLEECSDARACPTHEFWKHARHEIEIKLRRTSLADVIAFEAAKKRKQTPSGNARKTSSKS